MNNYQDYLAMDAGLDKGWICSSANKGYTYDDSGKVTDVSGNATFRSIYKISEWKAEGSMLEIHYEGLGTTFSAVAPEECKHYKNVLRKYIPEKESGFSKQK